MECGYKYRIYPSQEQEIQIQKTFGCVRFVFNHFLALRKELYETEKKSLSYNDCSALMTQMKQKPETQWLTEVDATALQSSLRFLDTAFKNFFRGLKQGSFVGFPRFKTKKSHHHSYISKKVGGNIKLFPDAVQLPKLGLVKCAVSRPIRGRILSAAVSQTCSGKYYVSLCCTDVEIEQFMPSDKAVGLDVGIMSFAVDSDGNSYANPKYLRSSQRKLIRAQRRLSRKTKGSRNRDRARVKLARIHEHIEAQRKDMLHKLTTQIIRENDVICLEDLNVGNMMKNHHLAQSIADASWHEFRRQLEYKADWHGRRIIIIDPKNTSRVCSVCGHVSDAVKSLSVRQWTCPVCGAEHDRDGNAAKNILARGMKQLQQAI